MAYDQELADRVRVLLAAEPVAEKPMFGGLALLVGGHMSVCVSGEGGLMVRVDPGATATLLAEPGAKEVTMGGRGPLKGWLRVDPEVLGTEDALRSWVDPGLAYARSLPLK